MKAFKNIIKNEDKKLNRNLSEISNQNSEKNSFYRIIKKAVLFTAVFAFLVSSVAAPITVVASNASNMEKVLTAYENGQIKKAEKWNKKLSKVAKETCVTKGMTASMKKAYKKVVKSYKKVNAQYVWDYFLTDYDNDKKADLLVEYGSCEADVQMFVYSYIDGKAQQMGAFYCGHSSFMAYPGHEGILLEQCHMGGEAIYKVVYEDGEFKLHLLGSRYVEVGDDYFSLRNRLKSHVSYDKNYKQKISYKDLKN